MDKDKERPRSACAVQAKDGISGQSLKIVSTEEDKIKQRVIAPLSLGIFSLRVCALRMRSFSVS